MKKNYFLLVILAFTIWSCNQESKVELKTGNWLGNIDIDLDNPDHVAPFNMVVSKDTEQNYKIIITNDTEKIVVDEIEVKGDSVFIYLPVFQNKIIGRLTKDSIVGTYIKPTYSMPFYAVYGEEDRFPEKTEAAKFDVSGRWKITENPGQENENILVGEFIQSGDLLTGTFLTVLGDYRYLEGKVSGDEMMLSCFDGAHSILFKAKIDSENSMTEGVFRGSPTWRSEWIANRDNDYVMPDAGDLTYLKNGIEMFDFSFRNTNGEYVSLTDKQFENKAVIVQILGTWCPNCMDETKYLATLYDKYRNEGLEIIALCFELKGYENSVKAINRFKKHNKANYTFLYAGPADKEEAGKVLPMLNKIISYPTAIFISKNREVRKIHTGFTGPGTGTHFEKLSKEFTETIESLLKE